MKERPILFSAEMVQAVLEGRKTQTRRIIKGESGNCIDVLIYNEKYGKELKCRNHVLDKRSLKKCPYGQIGDRLWVREAWAVNRYHDKLAPRHIDKDSSVFYLADEHCTFPYDAGCSTGKTRPSIFMPRWASRIMLEITDVRVERLNSISKADALAEGINPEKGTPIDSQLGFYDLWCRINGQESWADNPWVWVVEFKMVEGQ